MPGQVGVQCCSRCWCIYGVQEGQAQSLNPEGAEQLLQDHGGEHRVLLQVFAMRHFRFPLL